MTPSIPPLPIFLLALLLYRPQITLEGTVQEDLWKTGVGTVSTRNDWDGDNLWAVTDASNVVQERYLYGDGIDEAIGRIVLVGTNAGTTGYFITDTLGSIRDIVDGSSYTVLFHAEYGAYGAAVEFGTAYGDKLKFTAREYFSDTGLQQNRERWYDVSNGKWISEDPIGFGAGDWNLTRYASNRPTNATDSSGLQIGGGPGHGGPPASNPRGRGAVTPGSYTMGGFGSGNIVMRYPTRILTAAEKEAEIAKINPLTEYSFSCHPAISFDRGDFITTGGTWFWSLFTKVPFYEGVFSTIVIDQSVAKSKYWSGKTPVSDEEKKTRMGSKVRSIRMR